MPKQHAIQLGDTECSTWFERDRAHVNLHMKDRPGDTLVEWWDEGVREAFEDGFLSKNDLRGSAYEFWADNFSDDPFLTADEERMLEYMEQQFMTPWFDNRDFMTGERANGEYFCCPIRDYEPEPGDHEVETIPAKWWHRLSASGYMDRTDWFGPFDTEIEAVRACIDKYGNWDNPTVYA